MLDGSMEAAWPKFNNMASVLSSYVYIYLYIMVKLLHHPPIRIIVVWIQGLLSCGLNHMNGRNL